MRRSYCDVLVHAVWSTWDREPLLTPEVTPHVHAAIAAKCRELRCLPWAVGGIADHVHLLVGLCSSVSVAHLVQEVKGSSSHLVTHGLGRPRLFKWQGSYSAFSTCRSDAQRVREYILNQAAHHAREEVVHSWEPESGPEQAGPANPGCREGSDAIVTAHDIDTCRRRPTPTAHAAAGVLGEDAHRTRFASSAARPDAEEVAGRVGEAGGSTRA